MDNNEKLILLWNEQAGHPAAKHSERLRQERRVVLASPPSEAALTAAVGGRQHMWKMWKVRESILRYFCYDSFQSIFYCWPV